MNANSFKHSLIFILLLDKFNVCPTTLSGTHFQSVRLVLVYTNKEVSVWKSVENRLLLTLLLVLI